MGLATPPGPSFEEMLAQASGQVRPGGGAQLRATLRPLFQHPQAIADQARGHLLLAAVEALGGRSEQQRAHLQAALSVAEESDDLPLQVEALLALAGLELALGRVSNASADVASARVLSAAPLPAALQARLELTAAAVALAQRDPVEARNAIERCAAYARTGR